MNLLKRLLNEKVKKAKRKKDLLKKLSIIDTAGSNRMIQELFKRK